MNYFIPSWKKPLRFPAIWQWLTRHWGFEVVRIGSNQAVF